MAFAVSILKSKVSSFLWINDCYYILFVLFVKYFYSIKFTDTLIDNFEMLVIIFEDIVPVVN